MEFKKDLEFFISVIHTKSSKSEIRKVYINLAKKYHPDKASRENVQKFNEYMIILNKIYCSGTEESLRLKKIRESAEIKKNSSRETGNVYTLGRYSFKDYYEYLYFIGKKYFEAGMLNLNKFHYTNGYYDVNELKKNTAKSVDYFYQAMKCFNCVEKKSTKQYLRSVARAELEDVYKHNRVISRQLAVETGKEVVEKNQE